MLPSKFRPEPRPRILISYWYFKKRDVAEILSRFNQKPDVFADSGAFSAWSLGGSVNVDEYGDWLLKWKEHFTLYANLDVKGDVEAGLRNQRRLESRGLSPIPVWHSGEPWSVLEDMVADYPYIALGGLAGGANANGSDTVKKMLIRCFQIAQGRSVYHGFGLTNPVIMSMFPWYSVDSTTWNTGVRFATQIVFNYRTGAYEKLKYRQRLKAYAMRDLLQSYGCDWKYIDRPGKGQRREMLMLGASSFAVAEQWLRVQHGIVEHPVTKGKGIRIYMADTNVENLVLVEEARRRVAAQETEVAHG